MPRRRRSARAHSPSAIRRAVAGQFRARGRWGERRRACPAGAGRHAVRLVDVRRSGVQSSPRHQRAGGRAAQTADRSAGQGIPAAIGALARPACRSDRGSDRPRSGTGAEDREPAPGERHQDRHRRFWRRLFIVLEPARAAVCRAEARPLLRPGLRYRRHQRRDLPDRDRPGASLRQRRSRRWRRICRPTCRRSW